MWYCKSVPHTVGEKMIQFDNLKDLMTLILSSMSHLEMKITSSFKTGVPQVYKHGLKMESDISVLLLHKLNV